MITVEKYDGQTELAADLYAILEDVYEQAPWTLQQLEADLARPEMTYYLARDEEKVVAFMAVQTLVDTGELLQIAVKKAYQGQGIAKCLLTCLADFSGDVFLEVRASNSVAQALYQKSGFFPIGRRKQYYHHPLEDAIVMKREGNEG